jgi:hypothetical protein
MPRSIRPTRARRLSDASADHTEARKGGAAIVAQPLRETTRSPDARPGRIFQGHAAAQRDLLGLVDHAHAAPAEFGQDLRAGDRPVVAVMPSPALPEELVILGK